LTKSAMTSDCHPGGDGARGFVSDINAPSI
jgi:hypothetical protein